MGWAAVPHIQQLIAAFRAADLPILYPHVAPKLAEDRGGTLGQKVPGIMDVPDRGYLFPDEVAPQPGDLLLPKKHPSAFFGTPLASYLIGLGVDTIVVSGCTTSGCVRGTVVDGSPTTSAASCRPTRSTTARRRCTRPTSSTWARSTPTW